MTPLTTLALGNGDDPKCRLKACGALAAGGPRCRRSGQALILEGKKVDIVIKATPSIEILLDPHRCCIDPLLEICLSLDELYKMTGQGRLEALWRTIIADTANFFQGGEISPAPDNFFDKFSGWVLNYSVLAALRTGRENDGLETNRILLTVEMRNSLFRNSSVKLPTAEMVVERAKINRCWHSYRECT